MILIIIFSLIHGCHYPELALSQVLISIEYLTTLQMGNMKYQQTEDFLRRLLR